MMRNNYTVDNSGNNQGVMLGGDNYGNIEVSIQNVMRMPSLISQIVQSLGEACSYDDMESISDLKEYKPDEKIEYNGVVKYRQIIREFSAYDSVCESFLNAYDDSNMRGKAKILKCVYELYLEAKGSILLEYKNSGKKEIEIIRENSDRVIDMVKNEIVEMIKMANGIEDLYIEDMKLGVTCFVCYCFIKCKILEKPL